MSEELGEKPVTGTQSIDRACDLLIRVINSEDPQTLSELVADFWPEAQLVALKLGQF